MILKRIESGGWSTRELRTIIRGLEGLLIVGADVVEVATPYDTQAELTVLAAADVIYEVSRRPICCQSGEAHLPSHPQVMSLMVLKGPLIKAD